MDNREYFDQLKGYLDNAYATASEARSRGYDPETFVEIKPALDLPSRIEGITGIEGLAEIIRQKNLKSRQELAFAMADEICTSERFASPVEKRLTIAVRVGLAVLTEGVLVAPTEGFVRATLHKNPDGSTYVALLFAGPIRGAGGTSAALSVTIADYCRKRLGIDSYKAQKREIERYVEEINLYHSRIARLQYYPKEADIRVIVENCPVCVDGIPTEEMEVSMHKNIKRLDANGKEELISNRVRGGAALVLCEGIAQKAKSVLKHAKNAGLDWSWLNNLIRADKIDKGQLQKSGAVAVFLEELVAGRPVLSYPNFPGAFRLRYGRSRFTGIAAKGLSPASMIILDEFIATGTQLKVEKPGKGCIAMPVDTIEGPFVKLDDGSALRINSADEALILKDRIRKIIAVGDILITTGDFKKTNTVMQPTSYVEEYWNAQLLSTSYKGELPQISSFKEAYALSKEYGVPMHPRYTYDYGDLTAGELKGIANAISKAKLQTKKLFEVEELALSEFSIQKDAAVLAVERLCIPHLEANGSITIKGSDAQSLIASLGFSSNAEIDQGCTTLEDYAGEQALSLDMVNAAAPFKVMQRSTRIGGRMGRPEKARERLMKPPPSVLFPIEEYGGKERNITKAYMQDKRKFGSSSISVDTARYRCSEGGEPLASAYCTKHSCRAYIERVCGRCGRKSGSDTCEICGGYTKSHETKSVDLINMVELAASSLGIEQQRIPKLVKGVKGLVNKNKETEPMEKGILRSMHSISIFKDGTARFDATDAPMTHFYPKEVSVSIEALKKLGYETDYLGNPLDDEGQLVELKHQDVLLNTRGAQYLLRVSQFVDELLERYYKQKPFYNASTIEELLGHCVVTLSPHTSCGVLCRIIGFTDANVGFAHPYTITARRRNCDGDEDTTMLLLDALINFSKHYLPSTIGGTMDAPIILTANVHPEEVDDEVWDMEVAESYSKEFYDKTLERAMPGELSIERVSSRLNTEAAFGNLMFTHGSSSLALEKAPKRSMYTKMKSMQEKIMHQFSLMDKLYCIDKADTARRLILSHFIPDLMGNLHSFSKQTFRCISCNAKYRRVPLIGKCKRCSGKLVLTISKGGIEKYLNTAIDLADRYDLEPYIKQRVILIKEEIENIFGMGTSGKNPTKQFNLASFM